MSGGGPEMLYYLYELNHAAVAPWRAAANFGRFFWKNPGNPLSGTYMARSMAASLDMFERVTRRYGKPNFGISETRIADRPYQVFEDVVWQRPFCRLLHFRREADGKSPPAELREKLLIVAPMSGHYATLLRGTVEALLPMPMSTSPIGPTPGRWRLARGGSTSTITSIT